MRDEQNKANGKLDFGAALFALKQGKRVARSGWNGKNMFIYLVKGSTIPASLLRNEAERHIGAGLEPNAPVEIGGHIDMKAADGSIVVGWLASQTDMLAEDWEILG